ncbi:MAG: Ig-like domain-containing protein, partial [Chloroflexi bacterium]|nr:Ig-like domain-containing protein [Chloroflexota bacterium]
MSSPTTRKTVLILAGLAFLFGLISLSCNLPAGLQERFFGADGTFTPTPAPTYTPQPLPPTIVESDPPIGSTISIQGAITIYFNQAMDQYSVEKALTSEPVLEGSFSWIDSATLLYQPAQSLAPNTNLVLKLDTSAKAANGLALPAALDLEFYTPDWLQPVTFLPSPGSIEIAPDSAVLVTFNQPVVALGDSLLDAPPAFDLQPAPAG